MRTLLILALAATVLIPAGCTQPLPGVLTLAPAGMTTRGTCAPQADGTLKMHPGATAESTVYADAGSVTIAVTAQAVSSGPSVTLALWFAGNQVGTVHVEPNHAQTFPFQLRVHASGPAFLRIVVPSEPGAEATQPSIHLQKIVITEP